MKSASHTRTGSTSKQATLSTLDIVRYYLSIAPGALAGIEDRPLVLKRFVNGAEGEAFYQKRAPAERPSWLRTIILSFPSGRTAEELSSTMRQGLWRDRGEGGMNEQPEPAGCYQSLPGVPRAFGEGMNSLPEPPIWFHPLAPDVKCPACGADLTFIRTRGRRDLYQCTCGACKCQVMHYLNKETQTCGYAPVYRSGAFGVWTACGEKPAAKE